MAREPIPVSVEDGALYRAEPKIHPREIHGRFQRLRIAAVFWLLGMFYLFPWLRWDGRQAVLFDLPARKFYVFGLNFWPQDFFLLALLLMIAGLTLFFFTALAGRLWCGYACPQTVWTEVFVWIEQRFEGDRNRRMKLDKAPWNRDKLLRRGSKHVVWVLFALWTGFTFVGFFTPITELAARAWPFAWGGWETFWVLFYAFATWGNAGFLREQVCKYMCPYARFQSAMFDNNTLIIAYDESRGEPRGSRRRGVPSKAERTAAEAVGDSRLDLNQHPPAPQAASAAAAHLRAVAPSSRGGDPSPAPPAMDGGAGSNEAGAAGAAAAPGAAADAQSASPHSVPMQSPSADALGDCIDCTLCVQVCPTGIDIRDGLQYECIACGACIDACDSVMDRMGYPRGLVRYDTQHGLEGKPTRVLRPRVLVYGAILALLLAGFAWGVASRAPLIVDVLRDRNALYRAAPDGGIENAYELKLINKTREPLQLSIDVAGHPAVTLVDGPLRVEVAAEQVLSLPVTLRADTGAFDGRQDIRFVVRSEGDDELQVDQATRFFAPFASPTP